MMRGEHNRHVPFVIAKIDAHVVTAPTFDLHLGADSIERTNTRLNHALAKDFDFGMVFVIVTAHRRVIRRARQKRHGAHAIYGRKQIVNSRGLADTQLPWDRIGAGGLVVIDGSFAGAAGFAHDWLRAVR